MPDCMMKNRSAPKVLERTGEGLGQTEAQRDLLAWRD